MSTKIMSLCWPVEGLTILQKAVLISLADQANDDGVCWPSAGTIAKRTCSCERAVRGAILDLETLGAIRRTERQGRSTLYTITIDSYKPRQEMHPGIKCTPAPDAPQPRQEMHPGIKCTPAPDAPQPRQEMPDTPAGNAPRTVIEPSTEPSMAKRKRSQPVQLKNYLDSCRKENTKPIPDDDAVFKYAECAGIPDDFLWLCWLEFVERNLASRTRYANWRQAFGNCVRQCWYKLWWVDSEGVYKLTTAGIQAQRTHAERAA